MTNKEVLKDKVARFYSENPTLASDFMATLIDQDFDKLRDMIKNVMRYFSIIEWADLSDYLDYDEIRNLFDDPEIEAFTEAIEDERDKRLELDEES